MLRLARRRFGVVKDMLRRQRAIRHDMAARLRVGGAEHRPAHFHRHVMGGLDHAEGAAMAGAALDHIHRRLGNQPQHLRRLGAHILGAGVTGQMHGDAFGQGLQAVRQAFLLAMSTTYSSMSKVASATRFTSALSGQISAHSNFSIKPQDAVSATMS